MGRLHSTEKKKPKYKPSTKYDKILRQISAKDKEASHDKKFEKYEKDLRSQSKNSVDKSQHSSEKKKKRKRRNISSKESLQQCLSGEGNQEGEISDDDACNSENERMDESMEFNAIGEGVNLTEANQLNKEEELKKKIMLDLKATFYANSEDNKIQESSEDQNGIPEKKKNIRKPSIPKVKGYHSWMTWNRQGLQPHLFRTNHDLYIESKMEEEFPTELLLGKSWVYDNYDSDKVNYNQKNNPIQIQCCICHKEINGISIPLWKGFHVDEECFKIF